jgi:DDE superfamily endonuclease
VVVARLLPPGAPIVLAVDDTLFRRSGRKVAGAAWQHDGAAKGRRANMVSWGTCFVVAGVLVELPFCRRPVCLPVLARLARPNAATTKQVIAAQLVTAVAAAHPDRTLHVVADAWYAGAAGAQGAARGATRARAWPAQVTLTCRLRVNAVLSAIATPTPGSRGRPRRIGARLGRPSELAATARWRRLRVRRYGRDDLVHLAEVRCLWYGVYRSQPVRVLLVRDRDSRARAGYDLALVSTDLTSPAEQLVTRYATRWAIEVAFANAKQLTGVGQARNRTPRAVERTVPFGLIGQSIVVVWYTLHGHHPHITAERRRQAPWYRTKTEPAYLDMIVTLRRTLIAARFRAGKARTPTPEETLAVHAAWADAAA